MTDSPDDTRRLSADLSQGNNDHSPSPTPSVDAMDADAKGSRKREREVSLEPVQTKTLSDYDTLAHEHRGSLAPWKKNRRQLDTTREEEDDGEPSRSRSPSPSLSVSPPQEMKIKVRQISQGVEDLSWRNMQPLSPDGVVDTDCANAERNDQVILHDDSGLVGESNMTKDPSDLSPSLSGTGEASANSPSPCENESTGSRLDSEGLDKGIKRKLVDRAVSQGPSESEGHKQPLDEPSKRARDGSDQDGEAQQCAVPSSKPPSPKAQKLSGFMAFASTSSPFASVKGPSLFSSANQATPTAVAGKVPPSSSMSGSFLRHGESSARTPTAVKRSGFEAFSTNVSPFLSATRSKSPVGSTTMMNRLKSQALRNSPSNSNAFASYANSTPSFAVPMPKRARAASPDNSTRSSLERNTSLGVLDLKEGGDSLAGDESDEAYTSFSERLRESRDEGEFRRDEEARKPVLTEKNLTTGEEDEETVYQTRGKLFVMSNGQWKERGTGLFKVNTKQDSSYTRLLMRKEAVYNIILNVMLFPNMRCFLAQDPRYVRFSVIENSLTTHYNLRLRNAKIAQELLDEILPRVPGNDTSSTS